VLPVATLADPQSAFYL